MERCWQQEPDFRPSFEFLRQKLVTYIEKKMYLEMNMSKYSSAKYSQVEDKAEFEENPAGRAAQARNRPIPPPRNFKWTSLRQPSNNQQGEIV